MFNKLEFPTDIQDRLLTIRIMQGGTLLAPLQWEKAHLPVGIGLAVALLHKILVAVKTCLSIVTDTQRPEFAVLTNDEAKI